LERHLHKMHLSRRVRREFYELTDSEVEAARAEARIYAAEELPMKEKVTALAQQECEGELLQPGERERRLHQLLLQAREAKYGADAECEHLENELKLAIGTSPGLEGLATWMTYTRTSLDEQAFKLAEPE